MPQLFQLMMTWHVSKNLGGDVWMKNFWGSLQGQSCIIVTSYMEGKSLKGWSMVLYSINMGNEIAFKCFCSLWSAITHSWKVSVLTGIVCLFWLFLLICIFYHLDLDSEYSSTLLCNYLNSKLLETPTDQLDAAESSKFLSKNLNMWCFRQLVGETFFQ